MYSPGTNRPKETSVLYSLVAVVLAQPSTLKSPVPTFNPAVGASTTSSTPSNKNPEPTLPALNAAPDRSVPWLGPRQSSASLSPGHQLTNPAGAETQAAVWPKPGVQEKNIAAHMATKVQQRGKYIG